MSTAQPTSPEDRSPDANVDPKTDASPELSTERRAPWRLTLFKPKVGIPLAVFLVLAAIPLTYRSWRISSLPQIDEPFDVEAFCSVTIPDEENAFVEYREAFDLFVEFSGKNSDWNSHTQLVKGNWNEAPPGIDTWIRVNDPAFNAWLKGTAKPNAMFMRRRDVAYDGNYDLSNARSLTRLAMLKAGRHLRDGNTDEAWKILHAAFRYSRHVCQNGIVETRWIGTSSLAIVCEGLLSWAHHSNTTADDLDHAIDVLSGDFAAMTASFSETLKHEYLASQNCLRTLGQDSWVFTESSVEDSVLIFVFGEPEYSEALLKLLLANQLAGIEVAPSKRPALVARDDRIFDLPALPGKRISGVELATLLTQPSAISVQAGFPLIETSLYALNLERTCQSAMIALLSIESYARRHGQFPSSLEEFPKSFAMGLFTDPFHAGAGNLIYRADNDFAVVYSLGADGIDDRHDVAPPDDEQQNSWTKLRHDNRRWFEGYRIPLWRPTAEVQTDENNVPAVPDNVQD